MSGRKTCHLSCNNKLITLLHKYNTNCHLSLKWRGCDAFSFLFGATTDFGHHYWLPHLSDCQHMAPRKIEAACNAHMACVLTRSILREVQYHTGCHDTIHHVGYYMLRSASSTGLTDMCTCCVIINKNWLCVATRATTGCLRRWQFCAAARFKRWRIHAFVSHLLGALIAVLVINNSNYLWHKCAMNALVKML